MEKKGFPMPVKPIPEGYHTLTPMVHLKNVPRLIEFLKGAFGAAETMRFTLPDGNIMHAEMKIGDSVYMMGELMEDMPPSYSALYVYVPDTDATYRAALDAGGQSIMEPTDHFWGDRAAAVKDPVGNTWWIATHVEDVDPDELARRAEAMQNS
jgi:uncharacterized glyoxalase superfamily protein PhnB